MIDGIGQIPKAQRTKGQDGASRHGDAAIGLALAYYATTLDIVEYGYESGALAPVHGDRRDRDDAWRTVRVTGGFKARGGVW